MTKQTFFARAGTLKVSDLPPPVGIKPKVSFAVSNRLNNIKL